MFQKKSHRLTLQKQMRSARGPTDSNNAHFIAATERMKSEFSQRTLVLEEEIYSLRKDMREFKNEILTTIDWLVGEVQRFDIEQTLMSARWKPFPDAVNDRKREETE